MNTLRLERNEWQLDEASPLGPPGGFGEVFRGRGIDGDVAIKRLKLSAGAASHREMSIGAVLAERDHKYIVPVLDYGQDADSDRYYLVMPICEYSLQNFIDNNGPLSYSDAKLTILNIIAGLMEVQDIVHRDLKPGNILWHQGRWKIADFGIAKFVEDATSLDSLRSSLTPAYAAPEQWRGERPTSATDIYAIGCIFHTILTGSPPFQGDKETVQEAHLYTPAPTLTDVEHRLSGLIGTMLRKSPASRPTLQRCEFVVRALDASTASAGRAALAAAGNAVSQAEAAAEAERNARETAARLRRELEQEATSELDSIMNRLFDIIESSSEAILRDKRSITLGSAKLNLSEGSRVSMIGNNIARVGNDIYKPTWDVAANAYLVLICDMGANTVYRPNEYRFSTTLAFASIPGDDTFRWRELSFMELFSSRPNREQPIALNPLSREFAIALSNTMGAHQVACGPWTIDGEDEVSFQERWIRLFAKAATRQLQPPMQLPIPQSFFD